MTEWQPIETAPKDGTKVLLYHKDWYHVEIAFWVWRGKKAILKEHLPEGWWELPFDCMDALEPTHWMPDLPPES